ncbi:MAG: hypothetical protein ACWA41_04535 [Putridiphycobacter sp.]
MERLKGGIFITPKDIQILNNCSIRTAEKEHLAIRDILQIKSKKLTVKAYCKYWNLDYNTVVEYLNPYR